MCWNAEISISTFVFGVAAMVIAYINKTETLPWIMLYISVAAMQLLEFLIWRGWFDNKVLSMIGLMILMLQPVAAGLVIVNNSYKMIYYALYLVYVIIFLVHYSPFDFSTVANKNGHLQWNWLKASPMHIAIWTSFILIAVALSDVSVFSKSCIILFIITLTCISWYIYNKQGTWGSVYCSFINFMFVVILAKAFYSQYSAKYCL